MKVEDEERIAANLSKIMAMICITVLIVLVIRITLFGVNTFVMITVAMWLKSV